MLHLKTVLDSVHARHCPAITAGNKPVYVAFDVSAEQDVLIFYRKLDLRHIEGRVPLQYQANGIL